MNELFLIICCVEAGTMPLKSAKELAAKLLENVEKDNVFSQLVRLQLTQLAHCYRKAEFITKAKEALETMRGESK